MMIEIRIWNKILNIRMIIKQQIKILIQLPQMLITKIKMMTKKWKVMTTRMTMIEGILNVGRYVVLVTIIKKKILIHHQLLGLMAER